MAKATEAMLERVLQAPVTGGLSKASGRSLQDTELDQLAALMEQTKLSYPGQEIAPETAEMWFPAWMALVVKYGSEAMEAALREHMMESRFFPHPSELRERLEALRPARANVFVPTTRAEMLRLCGPDVAARMSELTVEECAEIYGAESARMYRAKLHKEGRG